MTRGLLISRTTKITLGKMASKNPSPANMDKFKKYRNLYNSTIKAGKKIYFARELKANQLNLKKTWQLLKQAAKIVKSNSESPNCFVINGEMITDPSVMANSLNDFFANMPSEIVSSIHPTDDLIVDDHAPDVPILNFTDVQLSSNELLEAITQLKPKTSLDFNNLSMCFLKKIVNEIIEPLKHSISLSLSTGVVPTQLKIAKIIPVYKSGDKTCMDNYRPISLLSCFSKICEKIVSNRLVTFLDINNLLSCNQFGFRKYHSTLHPMVQFTNFISNALNNKDHAIAIFCDLRKAFDTVDHTILLKKLKKLGIEGSALLWFKDYLQNRHQFVLLNGKTSSLRNIKIGVPQGSILGPILFLIYINDLPNCSLLLSLLFADDATAYASGKDIRQLINFINVEFQKITTYFRAHKMALHPAKTKFILFTNSNAIEASEVKILLNNNNPDENDPSKISRIERISANSTVPAMKFLGVHFDPNLNFKYHIKLLSSKLSRALYILRSVKNILSHDALRTIYFSVFHCHIIYAIQLWSCTSQSFLNEIFIKQKQAVRLINGASYNAHTEPLFKKSGILPLAELSLYFKLQLMQQYSQGFLPVSFDGVWIKNSERQHAEDQEERRRFEMRNFDDFYIPFSRLVSSDKLPLISFPKLWNLFQDHEIKLTRNKLQFNKKLKTHLLSKLNENVSCNRLLCQACHPFRV